MPEQGRAERTRKRTPNDNSSGSPNHARAGPAWRFLTLHASRRPPLAESVTGARSFAGASEGCCVERAWSHREAEGGQVEFGNRSCFGGML